MIIILKDLSHTASKEHHQLWREESSVRKADMPLSEGASPRTGTTPTKESASCKADIRDGLLQELGNDHVSILVFLLSSRAQKTEVLSSLHSCTLYPCTEPVGRR